MPETTSRAPSVTESIEAFLDLWPHAEFGPAHIVLSDENLGDGHIRWCLGLARAALSGNPNDLEDPPDDVSFMDSVNWYCSNDRDELAATILFLEQLLTIPEAQREAEAD